MIQIGNEELCISNAGAENTLSDIRTLDDLLLEKLDGKALYSAIEGVRKAGKSKGSGKRRSDGTIHVPFADYPYKVWKSFSVLEHDNNYQEHYIQNCDGVLPSEMSVSQIQTMLTFMVKGEQSSHGFVEQFLKDKTLLKLLLRLDDLLIRYYKNKQLPSELRYHNPVFWYEMDNKNTPVLVKGNGQRLTIAEKSDMFNQTRQSQQGWQRSKLYMKLNNISDVTSFAATMSATFAYGPDADGKCYTFTSCEEADRKMYKNLTQDQIDKCRKNVDHFYSDPKLQMQWKNVILHPVCLILTADGTLTPADISQLDSKILERHHPKTIAIGYRDSYKWIFKK